MANTRAFFRWDWSWLLRGFLELIGRQLGIDVLGERVQRTEVAEKLAKRNFQIEFSLQRLRHLSQKKRIESHFKK